jgi:CO/xanthine dehydrogenase Mo-binding subunit/aerobic-type carbon monoxide dehydrogenase small subunit (CoxS/CutS family)
VERSPARGSGVTLTVNGVSVSRNVDPRQSLVDFLRYELELTGSHVGCEHGVCGACTVRVDGRLARGCLMFAVQADGTHVETIEGLSESGAVKELQQAFRLENALQCGFCTSGLLVTAHDLLTRVPHPDDATIRNAISGNYCRCTGYHAIVRAVARAAALRRGDPGAVPPPPTRPEGGYIGRSVVRPETARLVAGRGVFTDDVKLPRMAHAAFVRSPHAHARIVAIDTAEAESLAGVVAVVTGPEMVMLCQPWVGVLLNYAGMKSARQYALAVDKAVWQGEPVVAVVAESRAIAEDGCARVRVTWEPLPPVVDPEAALAPGATVIHPELGDNLVLETRIDAGDVDHAFAEADAVYTDTFVTGRHTVVSLEPRAVVADYDPVDATLTVYHSGQAPYMLHDILARHLGIPEHKVRVINKDVGGSFGLKIHTYPDEMATCALAVKLGRPVKFVADRLESFPTDIHARDHRIQTAVAVKRDGTILAMRLDDLAGVGPFSVYPRSSVVETGQVLRTTPGPYRFRSYSARGRVVLTNKTPMSQYRAVGHPVAALVMEATVDRVARELGLDPIDVRRKNLLTSDMYPYTTPTGLFLEKLSHQESLETLLALANYVELRRERDALRRQRVYRGLGLAVFLDLTVPAAQTYGTGGARISSQDGTTIRLEPTGKLTVIASVTEQGQGTDTILAQVAATAVGVPIEDVRVVTGDTLVTPYGGGTWGSRGAGIGGEATLQSGKALRENILKVAAVVREVDPLALDIRQGHVVDARTGEALLPLAELGRIAYFRPDTLPKDFQSELTVTRHYVPRHQPLAYVNGAQLSYVDVDPDTGFTTLLGHWAVEDAGRIINPMLVDEQVRGGIVHGIGDALFEHCLYDDQGQLLTTTMMDYLVPMAGEVPDIAVAHVETPTAYAEGGFKGAGEGGVAGAPGAILNAVNDALAPLGGRVTRVPITPDVVLRALGKIEPPGRRRSGEPRASRPPRRR